MSQEKNIPYKLLVLDTSYSYEAILERGLQESVTCRDLNGFFQHVWTVHPFATLVTSDKWSQKYGLPVVHKITPSHTFIEGKMGRYSLLKITGPLNFLLGQIHLIFYLKNLIKKEKITVIRAGDMLFLGLLAWALSRLCKIPFVIRVGGNHDKVFETTGQPIQKRLFLNRKVEKKVEKFVLSRAHLVAGANQDNLNFALANGARPEFSTIFRYGNLIHKLHFTNPEERNSDTVLKELDVERKKFLLYIGRLEKVKHPEDVIKVLSKVSLVVPGLKAVLVGDGRMLNELNELAKELNLQDQVILCGNKQQEWLSQIIPAAAVVVSPHTGRALSEAALGGIPIVAYDVDWQSELIETGVTGELVQHGNVEAMTNSVKKFLSDTSYAQAMGDAVRKRTLEMMWPETLNQHEKDQYLALFERYNQNKQNLPALLTS